MHLWPSLRIRDSFKQGYLTKLEWNRQRMKRSQASTTAKDPLLESENNSKLVGIVAFSRDLLLLLSCCFCCFCCGACHDEEEN